MQTLVQVWIIEEHSLKVRKMQEPQEYAQTQVSEERRQRVSQAKKRYNCYTENIVIVLRSIYLWKRDSDVPEVIMKRRQQDAQAKAAKHCSTENRQQEQEAQAMAAKHQSESLRSTRSAVSTRYNQTFVARVYSCSNI